MACGTAAPGRDCNVPGGPKGDGPAKPKLTPEEKRRRREAVEAGRKAAREAEVHAADPHNAAGGGAALDAAAAARVGSTSQSVASPNVVETIDAFSLRTRHALSVARSSDLSIDPLPSASDSLNVNLTNWSQSTLAF